MSFDFNKMLKKEINVGLKEQRIRFGAGAALLLLSVFLGNILFLILGGVMVATGFMRWCPVYSGMGKTSVDPNDPIPTVTPSNHGH